MNKLKNFSKILFIFCFSILIVACANCAEYQWLEVKYETIVEMIDKNASFYAVFKRDDCQYCPEFIQVVQKVAKENNVTIYVVETSDMTKEEKEEYSKIFSKKYVPVIYYVFDGNVEKTILGEITEEEAVKLFKEE